MLKVNFSNIALIASLILTLQFLHGCAAVVVGTAATSAVVAQDRRTTGTIVEDKTIQLKVMHAINEVIKGNPDVRVDAISYNNRVLLIGQVPSRRLRTDIENAAKSVKKVRQIHNEITLSSPTPILQRSKDSWITTKIKSEMALTKDLNPTRVKVVTEGGIVYLMGIVNSQEEEITVDIARHTKGVKKVVKIFEYD